MRYLVDVDGTRVQVELEGDVARVDGGAPRHVSLAEIAGTPEMVVSIGDLDQAARHRVICTGDGGRGRYVLRMLGRRFTVEALDERTRAIRSLAATSARPAGPTPLKAPMPGLIVRVQVAPGDTVEAGQGIVVMEAMKMENELRAPAAGKVKAVHATVGAAVEKGMVLVEFE